MRFIHFFNAKTPILCTSIKLCRNKHTPRLQMQVEKNKKAVSFGYCAHSKILMTERMRLKKGIKYAIIQARKLACKGFRVPYFNERLLFAFCK